MNNQPVAAPVTSFNAEARTKARGNYRSNIIADILLNAPQLIHEWQSAYNVVDRQYQKLIASLSLQALTATLFTDKTGQPRAASNDTERDIAIKYMHTQSEDLQGLAETRDTLYTELQQAKNRFEGAARAAKLLAVRGA